MSANVFDAEDLRKARRELQKYNAMSREEYKNILGEEICKFCPWRNGIQFGIAWIVLHNLVDIELAFWSVANESHVALEHVPQLWQLVQVMVAQCGGQ